MIVITNYLIGLLFGVGIMLSGMANPAKVLAFFDVVGAWDPSLAFVMGGALIVTAIGYRLILRRSAPLLADDFSVPSQSILSPSLISGAVIFGLGWGLVGFCPGGALPALGAGRYEVWIFVGSLVVGVLLVHGLKTKGLSLSKLFDSVENQYEETNDDRLSS